MKILFLTNLGLENISDIQEKSIYNDLIRTFIQNGHEITVVSQSKFTTSYTHENLITLLKVKTAANIKIKSYIKKGLNLITQKSKFQKAIKKHIDFYEFDFVLYYSPPFIFNNLLKEIRKKYRIPTYLLIKDIFPQNSVDLGVLKKTGFRGLIYKYYRKQEQELYRLSSYIGCMSPANKAFLLKHNEITPDKIEVNPNSIEIVTHLRLTVEELHRLRLELGLPTDKTILMYGGNLGNPQGIDHLLDILELTKNDEELHFVVIGSGTNYEKIAKYNNLNSNFTLISALSHEKYANYLRCADIGLIFLDYRFTIPNFPSRVLSYMEYAKPVLIASDSNTDLKSVIVDNKIGYWSPSNNPQIFLDNIKKLKSSTEVTEYGNNARKFLEDNYDVTFTYNKIMEKMKD